MMQNKFNTIVADCKEVDKHLIANSDTAIEEIYLCPMARQVAVPAYRQQLCWLLAVMQAS